MTSILGERKDIVERDLVTSARKIPRRLLADVGKERQAR